MDRALRRLHDMTVHCESVDVAASLDGEDISGRYLLFEAINLRYVGPNMFLAPGGKPGDGLLDVVLVTEDERARLLEYLNKWQENRERRAVLPTRRGRRLKIEWTGYELHIDDKLYPREDDEPDEMAGIVEAWIEPAAVELLVPDARTLELLLAHERYPDLPRPRPYGPIPAEGAGRRRTPIRDARARCSPSPRCLSASMCRP